MFNLLNAPTAEARMNELERFIEFWVGPRCPDCGEPSRMLSRLALPQPLSRLYHFAGRWIPPHFRRHSPFAHHMFCVQDTLRNVENLQFTPDGKLIFLDENLGVWNCATECNGDDPPVWIAYGKNCTDWNIAHGSLNQCLVSFCLQELLFGSKFRIADDVSLAGLQPDLEKAVPLWSGTYVYGDEGPYRFSLIGNDLLVGVLHGNTWVAANSDAGVAKLKSLEGEINLIHVYGPEGWSFELNHDGSGKVHVFLIPASGARFPPGTFPFDHTLSRLLATTSKGPTAGKCTAYFFRRGQGSAEGHPINDPNFAMELINAAALAAHEKDPLFDAMFLQKAS